MFDMRILLLISIVSYSCWLLPIRADATPGETHRVVSHSATLRTSPLRDAEVVMNLAAGQRLMELQRIEKWVRVLVFGRIGVEGWVRRSSIEEETTHELESSSAEPTPKREVAFSGREKRVQYIVDISGSPGLSYVGDCVFVDKSGDRNRYDFKGLVPRRFKLTADALTCIVQKWDSHGRLKVGLFKGSNVLVRVETSAPFNYVRVRSDGPWGERSAFRGAIPSIILKRRQMRSHYE